MITFSFQSPNHLYLVLWQIYGCLPLKLGTLNYYQTFFYEHAVQIISRVRTVQSQEHDIPRWIPAKKKGDCTTKNIYRHLSSQLQVNLPAQCSRSITPQAHQILQRMWRQRNLLSLIKTFVYGSLEGLLQPEKEPQDTQFTSINIAAPVRQLRCSLILPLHFRPYSMVFCQPSSSH